LKTDGKDTERRKKPLVVFDVEGILIPKNRYLLFDISKKLGFLSFLRIVALGFLYETGILSLESAMRRIYGLLKGLTIKELFQIHKKIPLIPGTEEVFKKLNNNGYRTALISSGLPTQVVKDFATRLQAKYAQGLELEIVNEFLTGVIGGDVIKQGGKALVLKRILKKENLTPKDCTMVADDRNNVSMFPLCNLRIGYNPDFVLTVKSDFVTRGALTEILPAITGEKLPASKVSVSKSRGLRETIHLSSFLLTFICIYLTGNILLSYYIVVIAVLYTISEFARVRGFNLPVLSLITWNAASKTELYEFATAPIHFALGVVISLLFFPEPIRYLAITVLTLGDGGAHIFGMKFGKTKLAFNKGKNLEGTIFGFILAFLGALIFTNPMIALIAAAVGMLVEGIPSPINDNLTIPLATGVILTLIT
jgi:HAD superfamily phosphoserine phosphatase-like hydrolase